MFLFSPFKPRIRVRAFYAVNCFLARTPARAAAAKMDFKKRERNLREKEGTKIRTPNSASGKK